MSKLLTHGLSALMEAVNHSERSEKESDEMLEAFEQSIGADDAVVGCLMDDDGEEEDSVEDDMSGNGVGDDGEMEKLLAKIPPSDEAMEEQIEGLTESCLPILD